jgi:hypothetical protein
MKLVIIKNMFRSRCKLKVPDTEGPYLQACGVRWSKYSLQLLRKMHIIWYRLCFDYMFTTAPKTFQR